MIQSDNKKLLDEKIQQLENDYFVGLADKITDTKTGKLAGEYQNLTSQEYLDRLILILQELLKKDLTKILVRKLLQYNKCIGTR